MPPTCFSLMTEISPWRPGFSYNTYFLVDLLCEFCRQVANFVKAHHHHVSGNFEGHRIGYMIEGVNKKDGRVATFIHELDDTS